MMEIKIYPSYAVMIACLIAITVTAFYISPWPWVSIALAAFTLQSIGHEWMHVIIARIMRLEVEYIRLKSNFVGRRAQQVKDFLGTKLPLPDLPDSKLDYLGAVSFETLKDGRESWVFLSGFLFDAGCYLMMIAGMLLYPDNVSVPLSLVMAVLFWISARMPESDYNNFKRTFRRKR